MNFDTLQSLEEGFRNYISTLNHNTQKQYLDIVKQYLRNHVFGKVLSNDFESIFDINKIEEFRRYRKSDIVRFAITKFLRYLQEKELVDKRFYFEYPSSIKSASKNSEFVSIYDVETLFSIKISYRKEERYVAPLVQSLSFFYGFEHRHLMALKISDVIEESRLIRNIRQDTSDSLLVEWIRLNDLTFKYLKDYLRNRNELLSQDDHLLLFEQKPLTNSIISNKLIGLLNRKENKNQFQYQQTFNIQLLIKSGILYQLISSKGNSLSHTLLIQDWNVHVADARKEYLQNYFGYYEPDQLTISLNDMLFSFSEVQRLIDFNEENEIADVNDFPNATRIYSEEDDITMDDILYYEKGISTNLTDTKLTIQRLVRNSKITIQLKELYEHKCQLCACRLRNSKGGYTSEAHHIQPYNRTHRGDDTVRNLLVLCPNCHTQFDELYYAIDPLTKKVYCIFEDDEYHNSELTFIEGHDLDHRYLTYTWNQFIEKQANKETL